MILIGKRLSLPLAAIGILLALPGCETNPPSTSAGGGSGPSPAQINQPVVPRDFLATSFAPLQLWMDERFEVEYRNLTPAIVFDQQPIADIRYETIDLPTGVPLFNLKSANLSRREILYRIATFWNLQMTIEAENGTPSFVRVTGPAPGIR